MNGLKLALLVTLISYSLTGPAGIAILCAHCCIPCGCSAANILNMQPDAFSENGRICMQCLSDWGYLASKCFEENTKIKRVNHGITEEVIISSIKKGDDILTYDYKQKSDKIIKVLDNIKSSGHFSFLRIKTDKENKELTVTNNHVMIIKEGQKMKARKAEELKKNDIVLSDSGKELRISEIQYLELETKYTLVTEEGTVYSNGIYTSTLCGDFYEENEGKSFEELLKKW